MGCFVLSSTGGIERRTEPKGEGGGGQTKISAEILSRGRFPVVLESKKLHSLFGGVFL